MQQFDTDEFRSRLVLENHEWLEPLKIGLFLKKFFNCIRPRSRITYDNHSNCLDSDVDFVSAQVTAYCKRLDESQRLRTTDPQVPLFEADLNLLNNGDRHKATMLHHKSAFLGSGEAQTAMAMYYFQQLFSEQNVTYDEVDLDANIPADKINDNAHDQMWYYLEQSAEANYISPFMLMRLRSAEIHNNMRVKNDKFEVISRQFAAFYEQHYTTNSSTYILGPNGLADFHFTSERKSAETIQQKLNHHLNMAPQNETTLEQQIRLQILANESLMLNGDFEEAVDHFSKTIDFISSHSGPNDMLYKMLPHTWACEFYQTYCSIRQAELMLSIDCLQHSCNRRCDSYIRQLTEHIGECSKNDSSDAGVNYIQTAVQFRTDFESLKEFIFKTKQRIMQSESYKLFQAPGAPVLTEVPPVAPPVVEVLSVDVPTIQTPVPKLRRAHSAPTVSSKSNLLTGNGDDDDDSNMPPPVPLTRTLSKQDKAKLQQQLRAKVVKQQRAASPVPEPTSPLDVIHEEKRPTYNSVAVLPCDFLVPTGLAANAQSDTDCCPICTSSWNAFTMNTFATVLSCTHALCVTCLSQYSKQCLSDEKYLRCSLCNRELPSQIIPEIAESIVTQNFLTGLSNLVSRLCLQPEESKALLCKLLQHHDFDFQMAENTLFKLFGVITRNKQHMTCILEPETTAVFYSCRAPVELMYQEYEGLNTRLCSFIDTNVPEYVELSARLQTVSAELSALRLTAADNISSRLNNSKGKLHPVVASQNTVFLAMHNMNTDETKVVFRESVMPILGVFKTVIMYTGCPAETSPTARSANNSNNSRMKKQLFCIEDASLRSKNERIVAHLESIDVKCERMAGSDVCIKLFGSSKKV